VPVGLLLVVVLVLSTFFENEANRDAVTIIALCFAVDEFASECDHKV
jgi:hypothetical protein